MFKAVPRMTWSCDYTCSEQLGELGLREQKAELRVIGGNLGCLLRCGAEGGYFDIWSCARGGESVG